MPRYIVVLVHPETAVNVGASCRAMKAMGIRELRLVPNPDGLRASPGADPEADIVRTAVHAADLWFDRREYPSLARLLADTDLSAAFTRRRGRGRKAASMVPEDFAALAAAFTGTVALVFGNEEHGLSTQDVSLCSAAVHIPTDPEFGSLNLSHAVQIAAAAVFRSAGSRTASPPRRRGLPREKTQALARRLAASMDVRGMVSPGRRDQVAEVLRDIFERAGLSAGEEKTLLALANRGRLPQSPDPPVY